ncbi:MAG: sulfite exporter TauE/SafE family protein [Candidatus Eisenbacteria bacterium]|nr:sulfite exporter TauE/SafE family protein [Candidatus Eisenbacteria bacterium]
MHIQPEMLLTVLFFFAALLYSSVGHAGASGYLAAMALAGAAPAVMKPTALTLNLLVAAIGTVRFARAGHFRAGLFWPFAVGSVPFAFLGGALALPGTWYRVLVGAVLWGAAARMAWSAAHRDDRADRTVPRPLAAIAGAGIGFLSGITGTGGGIFLSPLVRQARWATIRQTSALVAAFILVNSAAGLAGHMISTRALPTALPVWLAAAGAGGLIGSGLGSRRLAPRTLGFLLAAVLVVAGAKLMFAR